MNSLVAASLALVLLGAGERTTIRPALGRTIYSPHRATAGGGGDPFQVSPVPQASLSGVNAAKSYGLRAVGKAQMTAGTLAATHPGSTYSTHVWLRDFYYGAMTYPGFYTSAYLRPVVDGFVDTIGGDPYGFTDYPAERIAANGTAVYRPGDGTWGYYPTFDNAPYLVMLAALTYERGDTTVYAAHRAAFEQALGAAPRDGSGRIYADPALTRSTYYTIGWGFEDAQHGLAGGLGMATALHAVAYDWLYKMAVAEGDTANATTYASARDGLKTALGTLHRVDHFYNASTADAVPHVMLTAMVVFFGLDSEANIAAAATAMLSAYTATSTYDGSGNGGNISFGGGIRHLVYPSYFYNGSGQNTFQNGAAWVGDWNGWVSYALGAAGGTSSQTQLLQDMATRFATWEANASAHSPWEWENNAGSKGALDYVATAAGLAHVSDSGGAPAAKTMSAWEWPASVLKDDYSTDKRATDYYMVGTGWAVSGGLLTNTGSADGQAGLWKTGGTTTNVRVKAKVRSASLTTTRFPCLMVRGDSTAQNGVFVLVSGSLLRVYDRASGVNTQRGSNGAVSLSNNTWYIITFEVAGTTAKVWVDGVLKLTVTGVTRTTAGYAGVYVGSAAATDAMDFDDLNIFPVPTLPAGYAVTGLPATGFASGEGLGLAAASTTYTLRDLTGAAVGSPVTVASGNGILVE